MWSPTDYWRSSCWSGLPASSEPRRLLDYEYPQRDCQVRHPGKAEERADTSHHSDGVGGYTTTAGPDWLGELRLVELRHIHLEHVSTGSDGGLSPERPTGDDWSSLVGQFRFPRG